VIGETALTDALPRAATVTALGPAVVYELGVDAIDLLRMRAPAAARAVASAGIKALIRRLRKLEERVEHELDQSEGP
jgi:CRP-like cAMP-binding protein